MKSTSKPNNLVEMAVSSFFKYADLPLFGTPDKNGNYTWVTYKTVKGRVDALRAGLSMLGITEGDAVGVIANNRQEWATTAFATFGLGGQFVPMYEKELVRVWRHIINDSGLKALFVSDKTIFEQVQAFRSETPMLEHLFLMDGTGAPTMKELEARGKKHPVGPIFPDPDDIAVLVYTSGTTGNPKGVLLSHDNFISNVRDGGGRFPEIGPQSRSLSILPWAHAYGQTAELYNFMDKGGAIGLIRNVTTVAEDMAAVAPTFLIAVPRVFNKIYDGIRTKVDDTGGVARKLFNMGLQSAAQIRKLDAQGKNAVLPKLKHAIADRIVFSKIRQRFGGCLNGALTASAMMNMEVAQFFTDIGIPVFDAYGLTETSPAVTINYRGAHKPGSVGQPIDNVQVVILPIDPTNPSGEGEVVVYGPNVMQGYHNNPEATRDVMTDDGGFRTGDLGRLDEDGYLFITGRIKEQYKLENGKYVFPVSLEEEIQLSPWVENALIFGEGRRHNICLVVPDFVKLETLAVKQGFDPHPEKLIDNSQVISMITDSIMSRLENKFGGYEIPKRIVLVEEPFSVENGMLTQTLKLKRQKVLERYQDRIEAAYLPN